MCRRYIPNTNCLSEAITRTNHSPSGGNITGRVARRPPALDRMLTNRTISGRDGSVPNGFSFSRRIRSTLAEHNFRLEWQLPQQCSTELSSQPRFPNDKRACSAHVDDIIVTQLSRQDAWAKCPVAANVNTPQENNQSHICHRNLRGLKLQIINYKLQIFRFTGSLPPIPATRPPHSPDARTHTDARPRPS